MKRSLHRIVVAGALAWTAGCATGPDFKPPEAPRSAGYGAAADGGKTASCKAAWRPGLDLNQEKERCTAPALIFRHRAGNIYDSLSQQVPWCCFSNPNSAALVEG